MSAEATGLFAIAKYFIWAPLVAVLGYFVKKRDNKIDELEKKLQQTITKEEAREMVKEANRQTNDRLDRFQQQFSEMNLTVQTINTNLTKLSTDMAVDKEVERRLKELKEEK